jgi:hypothetical protein
VAETRTGGGSDGPATDKHNDAVVDPTANVRDLVTAEKERADDLRELDARWRDRLDEIRAEHAKEMDRKESERIDAIRSVDVGNVQRAAEVQATQATTLAAQVAASAEALRAQLAATASAFDVKLAAVIDPIQKRIDDLTRVQFQAEGQKTQVVETRERGSSSGMWIGVVIAVMGLFISVAAVAAVVVIAMTK